MIRIVVHSPPLTVKQVAKLLGITPQRVLKLLWQKRIDGAFRLSGCWLITPNFRVRPGRRDGGPLKRRGSSLADLQQTEATDEAERASGV